MFLCSPRLETRGVYLHTRTRAHAHTHTELVPRHLIAIYSALVTLQSSSSLPPTVFSWSYWKELLQRNTRDEKKIINIGFFQCKINTLGEGKKPTTLEKAHCMETVSTQRHSRVFYVRFFSGVVFFPTTHTPPPFFFFFLSVTVCGQFKSHTRFIYLFWRREMRCAPFALRGRADPRVSR